MAISIHELKCNNSPNVTPLRRYFQVLILVSAIVSLVTLISYPLSGHGALSAILFQIGLGGENNVGAWWYGMLLLVAAVHAWRAAA